MTILCVDSLPHREEVLHVQWPSETAPREHSAEVLDLTTLSPRTHT